MKTFTFEGRYTDNDESGGRCDIISAPDRATAIRLAAMQVILGNEWDQDPERFNSYASLTAWHDLEIQILYEWEDLDGSACPNCTALITRDTMIEHGGGTIRECETCSFQWVPLGKAIRPEIEHQIAAAIEEADAFEAEHFNKDPAP